MRTVGMLCGSLLLLAACGGETAPDTTIGADAPDTTTASSAAEADVVPVEASPCSSERTPPDDGYSFRRRGISEQTRGVSTNVVGDDDGRVPGVSLHDLGVTILCDELGHLAPVGRRVLHVVPP